MEQIADNAHYQEETFKNGAYAEQTFSRCTFEDCRFCHCDFSSSFFSSCTFESCTFESCNLSTLHIGNSTFRDVCFTDSKLIGILWHECQKGGFSLQIKFERSLLNYSSFYDVDLRSCGFDAVSAAEVDFSGANLSKCVLKDTDLSRSTFHQTNLLGTDFTTARNYLLDPSDNRVKGAKFSLPEATNLLYAFGIKIQP